MSLAELLVAMTVFVVAAAVALILYNALTRSYKLGDNAADVQQNTRIAFENLVTDVRMMGFNFNPDGATRPDEQLEGAWDTAITLRGDFDFDDPTKNTTPEVALAAGGSPYNIVSVGNDEIVTYVLAKPGATTGASLTFLADVGGSERDGAVESVTIPNIALVQSSPPYTLYRVTVNPSSTSVTRQPVADNVYSLEFLYYDSGGALVNPATPADPSDDIGGGDTSAAQALRAGVRRVEVRLTGMTPDPDPQYSDADDPIAATRKHRKFTLMQDVVPRNAGYVGRPDMDRLPPSTPANVVACPGHCQSMLVKWDAAPVNDAVSQWTVLSGASATVLSNPKTFTTAPALVTGLTEGSSYYFKVRAEDAAGNVSPASALAAPAPATVGDINTPSAVFNLAVSGSTASASPAVEDLIRLAWSPVTTNVESVTCDPQPNRLRDLKGYRLYRSTAAGGVFNPANLYLDENTLGAAKGAHDDRNVVACRRYYYDITAVDKCGNESQPLAAEGNGVATTQFVPQQPGGLIATPAGADTVALSWSRVTQNTNDPPDNILVDRYRVYRISSTSGLPASSVESASWLAISDVTVSDVNNPSWVDATALALPYGMSYYYRVSALTDCSPPQDEGAMSAPVEAALCNFGGFIVLSPYDGSTVTGATTVSVYVSGADVFTGYVVITGPGAAVVAQEGNASNPQTAPFSFTWDTTALPPGDYTIVATVTNSSGCTESASSTVSVTAPVACCLAPLSPVLGPISGRLSARFSDVIFSLVNNCAQDLLVSQQVITWTDVTGNSTDLQDFCYDVPASTAPEDCTPVLTFSPPTSPPANPVHVPELSFPATRDDLDPLIVGYKFTTGLVTGTDPSDLGETITINMLYRTVGASQDSQCQFVIQTNPLSVITVEP
jgi:hypothetical protein